MSEGESGGGEVLMEISEGESADPSFMPEDETSSEEEPPSRKRSRLSGDRPPTLPVPSQQPSDAVRAQTGTQFSKTHFFS